MADTLATLVSSRICHDLISPIGAIGNGVELLQLTGGESGSEIALISDSVMNASARIRFFRIAFGAAGKEQMISRKEVLGILSASAIGGRMTYFWQVEGDQPRTDVRIAFLLLLCFESALPVGGDITITKEGETWILTGSGSRLQVDAPRWQYLTEQRHKIERSAALVQFELLPRVMAEGPKTLAIDITDHNITVQF